MTVQHGYTEVRGMRVHYLHDGDSGGPVLLLHGGGADSASLSWGHLMTPLATAHRVFAPDWSGYGESDRPAIEYAMPVYISVLGDLIEVLALVRPSLVGTSLGGAAALGYALDQPGSVRKLVLVDSYGLQDRAPAHKLSYLLTRMPLVNDLIWTTIARNRSMARVALRGIFHGPRHISEGFLDLFFAELNKPRTGAAFRSFQRNEMRWQGMHTVYMDQLDKLYVPTLIVHGAQDRLVPLRFAEQAHGRIPESQLRVLPNAGHWAQREQPEAFREAVSSFLSE